MTRRDSSTIQGETGIPVDPATEHELTEPTYGSQTGSSFESTSGADIGQQEHPLGEAGRETAQTAGQLAERAKETGFRQADRGREQAAEGLQSLAGNIRRISGDMETQQPAIANVADTVAEQTERLASYLRETDAREMLRTVEDAARKQPLLFLGGAFVLGVAAARFLKAAGGQDATGRRWRMTSPAGTYALDSRTGRLVKG